MAAILAMAAIGAWAIGTNRVSYVVTQGISMNPVYYEGDLVIVVKANSYKVGEIAAYHGSSPGLKVLHRIVGGDPINGYVFKGDNNSSADVAEPTGDKLIGRALLHVPKGGIWLRPLLSPTGLGMLGFLVFGSTVATARTKREIPRGRRRKKVRAMARGANTWEAVRAVLETVRRMPPLSQAAAGLILVVTSSAVVLGILGWMRPTVEANPAPYAGRSMTFSYSAPVPKSPAYDGTLVTSPDPIFRKIVDHVDAHVHYLGPPGSLEIFATLSDDSGWHSRMDLVSARRFSGRAYDATVKLDLAAIDKRAKAAAVSIGADSSTVTIQLTAKVISDEAPAFTPSVRLTLAPLRLSVSENTPSLVVRDAASQQRSTSERTVNVFGRDIITAAHCRSWAVLLLLSAVVGCIALFLVARRDAPARTRQQIERRYPQLLVHVEPMASPPGKPVVNVDNFPALVKLAERYGQMILTWRRPDADDFVVRDEGITYRYRVPLDEPILQNVELINRPSGAGSHRRKASSEVS
ncbi:DUF5305 family protein [Actinoplanes sp. CA-030573]|uniref:DUF5305 family protein n=1 Tax=Actinoplanes sp. CA-030573 TaxID=3239898 RepID=UPI003D9195EA